VTPSRLPTEMQTRIFDCAARTVRALGLSEGPLHAEFRGERRRSVGSRSGASAHWRALLSHTAFGPDRIFWRNSP